MSNDNLIVITSDAPLGEICRRLPEAATHHKFGVLGSHDLKEKMQSKGVDFARECRVFEVCNPRQAKEVLEASMEVSTSLPCRIAVYEENGQTVLATVKPTKLFTLYDAAGAEAAAREVEANMIRIMRESAGAG